MSVPCRLFCLRSRLACAAVGVVGDGEGRIAYAAAVNLFSAAGFLFGVAACALLIFLVRVRAVIVASGVIMTQSRCKLSSADCAFLRGCAGCCCARGVTLAANYRFCLGFAAQGTGIGLYAVIQAGRLFGYYSIVKLVISWAGKLCSTNRAFLRGCAGCCCAWGVTLGGY